LQSFLREVGRLRPNLLVNLTSDSWFGAGTEPWEHLALSVFATVELRVSMVRAVNSGVSVLIDPNDRVLEKTYANDPYRHPRDSDGIIVAAPMMPPAHTWFLFLGNTFAYLCAVASGVLLAGSAWPLRRRK
jgi:apolipoprotein N-acyltransferase